MPQLSTQPATDATSKARRLLHIEPSDIDAMKLKLSLRDQLPEGVAVDFVSSFEDGIQQLRDFAYEAILLGLPETDAHSLDLINRFSSEANGTPVLVLTSDENQDAAVSAGRSGASHFLLKSTLTSQQLCNVLREMLEFEDYENASLERRRHTRYPLEAAAVIFPIEADGRPGREIVATTIDISQSGIVVLAQQDSDLVPDICVIGVECPDGVYRYSAIEWKNRRLALPAVRFGGRFLRRADDPFHVSRLTPRFDPTKCRFQTGMDSSVLHEWVARGILRPAVIDMMKVCPQCEAIPTFRDGCPNCGSALTDNCPVIHHFACAHVAPATEFDGDCISCPKCRAKNLVVGADFEYLSGPRSCRECDWSNANLALIGECLGCGHRFPGHEAHEKEVFEYHVDRLDPLALIDLV